VCHYLRLGSNGVALAKGELLLIFRHDLTKVVVEARDTVHLFDLCTSLRQNIGIILFISTTGMIVKLLLPPRVAGPCEMFGHGRGEGGCVGGVVAHYLMKINLEDITCTLQTAWHVHSCKPAGKNK